jgi:DNA-binding transcriptional regulator LsrR (DeoR family)
MRTKRRAPEKRGLTAIQERQNLLYRVAGMKYGKYGQEKRNAQIAKIVKCSESQVGLLLKEARDKGIVTISVNIPTSETLGRRLRDRFGLREAIVIAHDRDCADLLKQLAERAAIYFDETVRDGSKIAIGGGYLMYEMISRLPDRPRKINLYPAAIIGRGPEINHIDPITLVTVLWTKCGREKGLAHYVTVTPPETEDDRTRIRKHYADLRRSRRVNQLISDMENVDNVFLSIGGLDADPEYVKVTRYASENLVTALGVSKDALRDEGAVGDIGYSFFDEEGNGRETWSIGIPLGLHALRSMSASPDKRVVVVAGAYKLKALHALLNNDKKCCNVLITDSLAADKLLDET